SRWRPPRATPAIPRAPAGSRKRAPDSLTENPTERPRAAAKSHHVRAAPRDESERERDTTVKHDSFLIAIVVDTRISAKKSTTHLTTQDVIWAFQSPRCSRLPATC